MTEFELKYGCNPNQKPAKIFMADGSELPIEILSGRPGYINFCRFLIGVTAVFKFKFFHYKAPYLFLLIILLSYLPLSRSI